MVLIVVLSRDQVWQQGHQNRPKRPEPAPRYWSQNWTLFETWAPFAASLQGRYEGPSLVPPQLEPQRLIPQRFVVLQFELQRFVVEKLGPQRPIPQRFVELQFELQRFVVEKPQPPIPQPFVVV